MNFKKKSTMLIKSFIAFKKLVRKPELLHFQLFKQFQGKFKYLPPNKASKELNYQVRKR